MVVILFDDISVHLFHHKQLQEFTEDCERSTKYIRK